MLRALAAGAAGFLRDCEREKGVRDGKLSFFKSRTAGEPDVYGSLCVQWRMVLHFCGIFFDLVVFEAATNIHIGLS